MSAVKDSTPGVRRQRAWDDAFNNEPSLRVDEHRMALVRLRAKMTPEERRRTDRVIAESRGLPMPKRLDVAREFLLPPISKFPPEEWNQAFENRLEHLTKST